MNKKELQVLNFIREIKINIEESNMPLDIQYKCIESMQKMLNLLEINN